MGWFTKEQEPVNSVNDFVIAALHKSQAIIEFEPDGTIITANQNFLATMGYQLAEVQGRHHKMFVDPSYATSAEYTQFWQSLAAGKFQSEEFKRYGKHGKEVWIQASYNPVYDDEGHLLKVIKFATDITALKRKTVDYQGQLDAISKSQAVIEFNLDGTIITANDNFLSAVGYSLPEIQGKHHSLFVQPEYAQSNEYRMFWQSLAAGQYQQAEYKRIAKGGKEIWIQASYNPIFDYNGNAYKVVKYAVDITEQKFKAADFSGQIEAIGRSQAVIEFNLDGTILTANNNFLGTVGFSLEEVKGKHHSMFVDAEYASSEEYQHFWQKLGSGKYFSGEFKRYGKNAQEIWIQASYNPILDSEGNPFKIVKYATDITADKIQSANFEGQIEAISRSQAVIEFDLDGTILTANDNFLTAMGYTLSEIKGYHHSIFVEQDYGRSTEYKKFWQRLAKGEFFSDEFKRLDKNGDEIWIQASYNPILDADGKPFKVVKFAVDISAQKAERLNYEGQINAISRSQAVIEFNLDGTIIHANDNFLTTIGYKLDEIKGRHHAIFVESDYAKSLEYKDFWNQLRNGEFFSGEYKRLNKVGDDVWISASYNPIFDANGKPFKVVKYATDITAEKNAAIKAREAANLASALKLCQANVMIADNDCNIVFVNDENMKMLKKRESKLKTVLSQFDTENLIGKCIDILHQNPAYQRNLLANLSEPYKTEIDLAGLTFSLTATPWMSIEGERLGTVVEWADRTEEVLVEREIDKLVESAASGDLSVRMTLEDKDGFFKNLGEGLNRLVDVSEVVMNDTVEMLDAMAHGNLTKRIEGDYQGAFGKLKEDANATVTKLTEIIARVNQSANMVASGADEIAQGNADLSQRTEEQASSLEETASSMEEMTSTVKQNADNAQIANQLASDAQTKAVQGGEVVERAVTGMSEINDSSKKIADIIGVIDEIAFQTNLLALNAAVEAARAGEQGRGFAVVAGEVRNLAQRSAEAAKEIKDLIRDSVAKVEDGS
ncbi:PAS domain-containing protein, partial [Catenovulum sp. SM1970]|uniref:methyl-accepting chemotaxis protein n=1 Tax=Marinifaba aquimaris TaxID=2741323 RepID=UPI001574DD2D